MITSNTPHDIDPIRELTTAIALGRQLATQARADLEAAVPILIDALRHHSGQSRKIEAILLSLWNDDHAVNLCDNLSGLDTKLAQAVVSMIAARAHLSGDADDLLRQILNYDLPPTTQAFWDAHRDVPISKLVSIQATLFTPSSEEASKDSLSENQT